jgi:4-amino-4-deoxy-L-arabinose transferase-like glycosyltransferase
VFVAVSLVRASLLGAFDLMPQSAYYATYAEHPALSYYDHPPMIGWLLWSWFSLFGKSAIVLRIAVFTTTLVTQLLVYALAGGLLRSRREEAAEGPDADGARGRALALFATTGMITQLSFIAVPDVPLLLFWTLALLLLHRILFESRTGLWPAAGLAMGLALLGKYTAVYLQGGLLLFLLASPDHRRHLRTAGPWLALLVAHLVALPVYVWNARHGFASFAYQSVGRAAEVTRFDWDDALGFLGSQVLVFLPVPLFAFLWLAGRDTWRALRGSVGIGRTPSASPVGAERLFLLCFSVPVFATCIALSTVTWVKSNWPMPAYVAATLLVATAVGRRAVRWHLVTSAFLHAVLVVQLLWYPIPVESDDTWYGWSELAERVEERIEEYPGVFVFSADNYKTTAELRFYAPELEVYGMNVIGWNALHFEYIGEDPADLAGRDALFVRSEDDLEPSAKTERYLGQVREFFESVREVEPIEIRRGEETVRLFRVFVCRSYRGPAGAGGTIPRP